MNTKKIITAKLSFIESFNKFPILCTFFFWFKKLLRRLILTYKNLNLSFLCKIEFLLKASSETLTSLWDTRYISSLDQKSKFTVDGTQQWFLNFLLLYFIDISITPSSSTYLKLIIHLSGDKTIHKCGFCLLRALLVV